MGNMQPKPPKPKKVDLVLDDANKRADNYQVSRSLPDLRTGKGRKPPATAVAKTGGKPAAEPAAESEADPEAETTVTKEKPLNSKKYRPDGSKMTRKERRAARKERRKSWPRWKRWLRKAAIMLLILLLLVGGWLGWKAYQNSNRLGTDLWSLFDNSRLKGEDRGHVNILLAGNSADDPGHGGADLTDSIMLLSINTTNNTAFILSIPRDLYVDIPGNGYAKINAAYTYGEQEGFSEPGYPEGGMGLLQKTLSETLDIPIDYYALVNYGAFRDGVNAVGGITVTIDSDSPYGLYDPYASLRLGNGTQELDGQTALNLARARGDGPGSFGFPQSDFDRTQNQRMMLLALREKAMSAGVLANPVKVGNLFDSAGNNIQTDLSLGNMRRLATITRDIGPQNIQSASLNDADGVNLLQSYRTRDGQSALVPAAGIDDYTDIRAYVQKLMAGTATGQESQSSRP